MSALICTGVRIDQQGHCHQSPPPGPNPPTHTMPCSFLPHSNFSPPPHLSYWHTSISDLQEKWQWGWEGEGLPASTPGCRLCWVYFAAGTSCIMTVTYHRHHHKARSEDRQLYKVSIRSGCWFGERGGIQNSKTVWTILMSPVVSQSLSFSLCFTWEVQLAILKDVAILSTPALSYSNSRNRPGFQTHQCLQLCCSRCVWSCSLWVKKMFDRLGLQSCCLWSIKRLIDERMKWCTTVWNHCSCTLIIVSTHSVTL